MHLDNSMKDKLIQKFGDLIQFDVPLSKYTTFKIGGPAKYFVQPKTNDELVDIFKFCKENNLPYFILGGGANVVLPDSGFDGLVIRPRNTELKINDQTVYAQAGVVLAKLSNETAKAGLTGLEWCIAVPGTVGGAVRGNAGAFGGEIKDTLIKATVFDGKEVKEWSNDDLQFFYRGSRIKKEQGNLLVIDATFKLEKTDPQTALAKVKELQDKKFAAQPMGELCAGCMFKNVELDQQQGNEAFQNSIPQEFKDAKRVPAGWIIEHLGIKGEVFEELGMKVSEKHANFLVNTGQGSEQSVRKLVNMIKQKAQETFDIDLEEEVQFV